jgi:hypothetical protein
MLALGIITLCLLAILLLGTVFICLGLAISEEEFLPLAIGSVPVLMLVVPIVYVALSLSRLS